MADLFITIYSLATVWLLGFLFLNILNLRLNSGLQLAMLAVDFGIGAGLLYLLLFCGSLLTGSLLPFLVYVTLAGLGAASIFFKKQVFGSLYVPRKDLIGLSIMLTVSAVIVVPVINTALDGDGWAIWAFKAKAFFEDGNISIAFLTDMERYAYAHLDYPLLIPVLEYWVYAHLGHVNDHVIRLVPISFWFMMLLFFYSTLSERIASRFAVVGTVLLATLWPITEYTVVGLVDVAQAFYNMAALYFLFRWADENNNKALVASAFLAGVGTNVKNEGLGFALSMMLALVLSSFIRLRKRSYTDAYYAAAIFACVVFILAAPWVIEKKVMGIGSELFLKGVPPMGIMIDRLEKIALFYFRETINIGLHGWGLLWLISILVGVRIVSNNMLLEERYRLYILPCIIQFFMFIAVYTITPHEFNFHIQTSGRRTLSQLAPALLLISMIILFSRRLEKGENIGRNVTRGHGLLENFLSRQRAKVAWSLMPTYQKNCRMLDIGCGLFPYFLINSQAEERYGLDRLSSKGIASRSKEQNVILIDQDVEEDAHLPFEDGYFDVVTMLAAIEHVNPAVISHLLHEVFRVLKPGGKVIITTPSPWTDGILKSMAKLGLVSREEIEEHKDSYSREKLTSLLRHAGFVHEKIKTGHFELRMNIWATADKQ